MQLQAIASRPIASELGEDTNTCLTTASFQEEEGRRGNCTGSGSPLDLIRYIPES